MTSVIDATDAPVRKSITVKATAEHAFQVFRALLFFTSSSGRPSRPPRWHGRDRVRSSRTAGTERSSRISAGGHSRAGGPFAGACAG
jgi:hypothetical protein